MRFIVRWLFRLAVVLLILTVALLLGKDLLLKELLQVHIRRETGIEARVGRFEVGLLAPTLRVEDLRLYDPPEFGGGVFLHVAECQIEYDVSALWDRRVRLRLLRLVVPEAGVVWTPTGDSNLAFLHRRLQARARAAGPSDFDFGGLDSLNVTLGRVTSRSLAAPGPVQTLSLGVQNEVFTNLRTPADLAMALTRIAWKAGLNQFTNLVTPAATAVRPR